MLSTIEAFKAVAFALNLKKTLKRPTVFDASVATGSTDRSPELLDGLDDLGRAAARRWSQDANRSEVFSSGFAKGRENQSNSLTPRFIVRLQGVVGYPCAVSV